MPPIRTTCLSTTGRSTATSSACGASSARSTRSSRPSRRSTEPVTASAMAESGFRDKIDARLDRLSWSRRLSLTTRILAVNLLPLALLGGGIFYLDTYRKQLLSERYKLARIEAQITAEALAGASRKRQEMRLRMFDAEGRLWADSFALDEPAFEFDDVGDDSFSIEFARVLDRWVDTIVGADPIPDYIEPEETIADAWPELARAREEG